MFNLTGSDGALTRTPESSTLIPGTLLRLNCSSDKSDSILWKFTPEGSSTVSISHLGALTKQFTPYFYIDSTSLYDLVARTSNANESYCGTYTCVENNGDPSGDNANATVASKCIAIQSEIVSTL